MVMKPKWTHVDYDIAYQNRPQALYRMELGRYRMSKQFRIKMVKRFIPNITAPNTRLLDVGCGSGIYFHNLGEDTSSVDCHGHIVGLDFSTSALQLARLNIGKDEPGISLIQADTQTLPFPDKMFHVILAFEVLEHIGDDQQAAQEFFRVLQPGGYAVASVPNSKHFPLSPVWFEQKRTGEIAIDKQAGHLRRYSRDSCDKVFTNAGFVIEQLLPYFHLFAAYLMLLNNKYLLRPQWVNTFVYKRMFFPTALSLCQLEAVVCSHIYRSYGLLIIAYKPD